MKKIILSRILVIAIFSLAFSSCATTKEAGISKATKQLDSIERILDYRLITDLSNFDGVALISLGKFGGGGVGIQSWTGTVYTKNSETGLFGPPSFFRAAGPSIGIAFGGVSVVDCFLVFEKKNEALNLAQRKFTFNFSNESTFAVWGRKQMTITGGKCFSDGAGLSLGAIEFEFMFGGPNKAIHENIYNNTSVGKILSGEVDVPKELDDIISRLNQFVSNDS